MNSWYKTMWERSNHMWDRFMREYVFSPDPPFEVGKTTKVLLTTQDRRPDLDLETAHPFVQYVDIKEFDEEIIRWMFDNQGRRTGFAQVLVMSREDIERIWGKSAI
jgi:hypothetical protein